MNANGMQMNAIGMQMNANGVHSLSLANKKKLPKAGMPTARMKRLSVAAGKISASNSSPLCKQ
jgi:hypothetical protein